MIKPITDKNLIQIQMTDFFSHYMLQNKTGTGHLLMYNVLPGLQVFYSNFHLKEFTFNFENQGKSLIVLHCHNGSSEWLNSESLPKSMEENGLLLLDSMPASKTFQFPVHCYHGIAVVFSMEHLTLEELSKQIEMSPTQMKKYFKLAYGDSIYSYLKTYRMKKATQLLMEGKFNVAEVASRVGYTNSSKFAQAFKEYAGSSPKEYRNKG